MMPVTIKDVAKDTKLAVSTISKYMNGGNVRPENKLIIEEAVQRLGYRPNHLARGLRNSRSYIIGLLIPSLIGAHSGKMVAALEAQMRKSDCFLTICCYQDSVELAKEYVDFLVEKGVDGIIVSPIQTKENYLKSANDAGIPVVILEDTYGNEKCDVVQVDCASASYELVECLIKKGHKRIAIIKGIEGMTTSRERLNGYLRVMEDYELPVNEEYLISGAYDYQSGYEGVQKLWQLENKPTALFITNYHMSVGALVAVRHLNIQIPEELSIVVFDDMELSTITNCRMTAVRQPMEEIMEQACEFIERRLSGDFRNYPEKKRIKAKIIYRNSVVQKDDYNE
ncbi:MAG: LacI family DNA-binding transcriptional regulator [Eubacteriales bacterium]|nr:LacI family DNA-binding transcriptional regulator [Eubacteriales bacterium]